MDIEEKWNYKQNLHSKTEWYRYYGEYSTAIDNLLERSDQRQATVLALPLLYLIRHSLELAFKMNIVELKKVSKISLDIKLFNEHCLDKLHDEFGRQVLKIINKENIDNKILQQFETRNQQLKEFRNIFDKLDKKSFAFRYPFSTDGETKSFEKGEVINLSDIIQVYKETQVILKYTTDVIVDTLDSK